MHVFKCTMNYFAETRILLQGKMAVKKASNECLWESHILPSATLVQIWLFFVMRWQVNHLIRSVGKNVEFQLMNCPPLTNATSRLSC